MNHFLHHCTLRSLIIRKARIDNTALTLGIGIHPITHYMIKSNTIKDLYIEDPVTYAIEILNNRILLRDASYYSKTIRKLIELCELFQDIYSKLVDKSAMKRNMQWLMTGLKIYPVTFKRREYFILSDKCEYKKEIYDIVISELKAIKKKAYNLVSDKDPGYESDGEGDYKKLKPDTFEGKCLENINRYYRKTNSSYRVLWDV